MFRKNPIKIFAVLGIALVAFSCKPEKPPVENDEEVISKVTLQFVSSTDTVYATAKDTDGEGVEELEVLDTIQLKANTAYTLSIKMENDLNTSEIVDISAEVEEEGLEHQIFFSFTTDAFSNPTGSGNIASTGTINYNDKDAADQPIGLNTSWTTSGALNDGFFRFKLQHQPDGIKTGTSGSTDGDTDVDISFVLDITAVEVISKSL